MLKVLKTEVELISEKKERKMKKRCCKKETD